MSAASGNWAGLPGADKRRPAFGPLHMTSEKPTSYRMMRWGGPFDYGAAQPGFQTPRTVPGVNAGFTSGKLPFASYERSSGMLGSSYKGIGRFYSQHVADANKSLHPAVADDNNNAAGG